MIVALVIKINDDFCLAAAHHAKLGSGDTRVEAANHTRATDDEPRAPDMTPWLLWCQGRDFVS